MKATTEVEVIPIWFIKKWCKQECQEDSPLWFFVHRMIKDWELEEIRHGNKK